MFAYVIRRLFATIVVMAVVAFVVFSLLYLTPGDPAAVIAGDAATDDDIRRIRAGLGLDEPFLVRFGGWVGGLLHGDLGISIFTNLPVTHLIAQRIEPTVALTVCTLLVAVLVAVLNVLLTEVDNQILLEHWSGSSDLLSTVRSFLAKADQMIGKGRLDSILDSLGIRKPAGPSPT